MNGKPLLLLSGLGLMSVVVMASSGSGRKTINRAVESSMDWIDRVINRVSKHEGGHDALNLNADGAGLSFGIIQWAQKPGTLGVLLGEFQKADPARFVRVFGAQATRMLSLAEAGSLSAIHGVYLWQEPWVSRFRAAGRDPVFIAVQNRLAREDKHFRGAVLAAKALGVETERSMALMYDTAVQQGPVFAIRLAERVRASTVGESEAEVLRRFALLAPAHFRSVSPPVKAYPSGHIAWKKTGDEWHAWAGRFDLYAGIMRRRMSIVNDPELSDARVALSDARVG